MTPANRQRLQRIMVRLNEAYDQNDDASSLTMILHESMSNMLSILSDLHYRPKINSEDPRKPVKRSRT